MVKKTLPDTTTETEVKKNRYIKTKLLVFVVLLVAAYGLWKNPQIVEQIEAALSSSSQKKIDVQTQITQLNEQIRLLEGKMTELAAQQDNKARFDELKNKVEAVEKINLNVIDSKADVATVLGVITRMDKAEQKLDNLAKVTDESALVLTAVMLVKDAAERGGEFEYEAEVLQQIAQSDVRFKEPLSAITKFATKGVPSAEVLKKDFAEVYKAELKEQKAAFEKTWTDRLNSKLSEIVQIKRVKNEAPKFELNQGLEFVKKQVEDGNFAVAVDELKRPANADLLKNDSLKKWLEKVQAYVEFNQAVSKVSASSLAVMKVNFLKNKK